MAAFGTVAVRYTLKRKCMTMPFHSVQYFEWPLPLVKLEGSLKALGGTMRAAEVTA